MSRQDRRRQWTSCFGIRTTADRTEKAIEFRAGAMDGGARNPALYRQSGIAREYGSVQAIALPPSAIPGGFTCNQCLDDDDHPLLYHTGPRKMFPRIRAAIDSVIPAGSLRYIAFSQCESNACGSLDEFLEPAAQAGPRCGQIAKLVSVDDIASRVMACTHGAAWQGDGAALLQQLAEWLDPGARPGR